MSAVLYEADCLDILPTLAENSIDSVVTDPPYHLTQLSRGGSPRSNDPKTPFGRTKLGDKGFMGQIWDGGDIAFRVALWQAVWRVMKPGAHLLAFSGTRTYHRMVVAIEDAGFEIRDQIGWLYGSGMPKSHNLTGEWEGYGTGLKPAFEPIVLARKPMIGTVKANMDAYQTGALNIDACRIPSEGGRQVNEASQDRRYTDQGSTDFAMIPGPRGVDPSGRWPANLLHDGSDEVEEAFAQYGDRGASAPVRGHEDSRTGQNGIYGHWERVPDTFFGDSGSASRFFYSSKAKKSERAGSLHPTVKPISLMRYLCRLVTPKSGTVLDPFAGTGTTGQAAVEEGFKAVLIEREPTYCLDIRRRLGPFLGQAGAPSLITFE